MPIYRYKLKKTQILLRQRLNTLPYEEQGAKLFMKYCTEHPEYKIDDLHMRVSSEEREEDHYGNGGGFDNFLEIYINAEETDDEYKERIDYLEFKAIKDYERSLEDKTTELRNTLNDGQTDSVDATIRAYTIMYDFAKRRLEFYNRVKKSNPGSQD